MKQYDNHFAVAVMICLKEIIFYISSYLNFRVGKYTIFLFSTIGRNIAANVWHMSSGGFRSRSLSTEAEPTIEVLRLATHKPRHYLYAVLANGFITS